MSLSLDDVRWVAHLARLDVPEQELAVLAGQLGAILDYVQQLQQLNTDGVEPLAHPLDIRDVFRPDEPTPSLTPDEALQNAPSRSGDFYSVPPVLE
ncbi:MAG: Asp-tRNA(Asn)/Glu-tRNA(Gln) amidotransferase subunit GatC [Gemmataceae bacterium]